jgi:GTP-binding protein YchF
VGKSLLFNALLGAEIAKSANYPFATINPNIGQASVPDERLFKLAELEQSEKVVPARIEYVDIAGLVRGASEGKGLGNQFLENIRNVNMIVQLVRCFEDPSITHVEDGIDPVRDMQIIHDELVLKDYQVMEKNRKKKPKGMDFDERIYTKVAESTFGVLEKNQWAITAPLEDDVDRGVQEALKLITSRPMVICCNVDVRFSAVTACLPSSFSPSNFIRRLPLLPETNIPRQ